MNHQLSIDNELIIGKCEYYLTSLTFTAFAPFGPISTSKVTLLFSLIASVNALIWIKTLSCVSRSLINPYPFASLKNVTIPVRIRSSGFTGSWRGTPISISSALMIIYFLGSGGVEERLPFSSR